MTKHNYYEFNKALERMGYTADMTQWKHTDKLNGDDIILNDGSGCLCGHRIEHSYYIRSIVRVTEVIRCGSTCIKMFMGKDILKPLCTHCGCIQYRKNGTTLCGPCKKIKKKTDHLMKVLKVKIMTRADILEANYRKSKGLCIDCECPMKNKKYDRCFTCVYKKCDSCGKRNIKHDSNYRMCYTCNTNSKKEIRRRILMGC